MSNAKRETLGAIWKCCNQMEYSASHAMTETLKAQFSALQKHMARLETIEEMIEGKKPWE